VQPELISLNEAHVKPLTNRPKQSTEAGFDTWMWKNDRSDKPETQSLSINEVNRERERNLKIF